MSNRLGTWELGNVLSHAAARLKEYTEKTISRELWTEIINAKVDELHELAGAKDKAVYKDRQVLNANADGKGFYLDSAGDSTYDMATKTITIKKADLPGGVISNSDDYMGAVILAIDTGSEEVFYFTVTNMIANDSTNLIITVNEHQGLLNNIGSGETYLVGKINISSSDEVNLSLTSIYKSIDQITGIYSTTAGECLNVTESEFWGINDPVYVNPLYRRKVVYYRDGEYLKFAKGAEVASYGTRTMYFTRKPYKSTELTDIIDIPDSNMSLLLDVIMLAGLQTIKVPIPAELKTAESKLAAMRQAKDEEIQKLLANSKDN